MRVDDQADQKKKGSAKGFWTNIRINFRRFQIRIGHRMTWTAIRQRMRDGLFEKLGLGYFTLLLALFGLKSRTISGGNLIVDNLSEAGLIFSLMFTLIFFICWFLIQLTFFVAAPRELIDFQNQESYVKANSDLYTNKEDKHIEDAIMAWLRWDKKHPIIRIFCFFVQLIGLISFLFANLILLISVVRLSLVVFPILIGQIQEP